MTPQEQYEHLVETVKSYNPAAGFDQIRAAYEFAAAHHAGQNRKDGSPFVTHPLAVAQIVAEELHLDTESIVAALLHDTIEDTTATHEEISHLFSPTVADLVEGVSKLTRVHYTSKEEEQMENLRKMLMAMAKDIRVILIKISDRLHNMRTMEYQTPEKQKQKSFETMEIYAPIAHRLGMQKMKWELEDLSLKYLDPVGYREITEALDEKAAEYDGFMSSIHDQITTRLREAGKLVIGMGESKALGPFVKACDQFRYLDLILDHGEPEEPSIAAPVAETNARATAGDDAAINRDSICRLVCDMIDEMDDGTGWVRTSRVGDQLIKRYPDFDVRNFGSKSLNKFLDSLPELEVEEQILANGNPIQFVHVKPTPKPAQKPPQRRTVKRTTRKKKQ